MKPRILTLVVSAVVFTVEIAGAQSIRSDFASFSNGRFSRYSTKGHPKAGPVELSIKYPIGWAIDEGEKPHIVKKMTRSIGLVQYSLMITVGDAVEGFNAVSAEDVEEMFQAGNWAEEFFPAPAIVHSQSATRFEAQPAGVAEASVFAERLGIRMRMRSRTLVFFCENRIVSISASVSTLDANADELAAKFAEARPLFFSMLNGATLNNAWAPPAAAGGPISNRGEKPAFPNVSGNPLDNPAGAGFWPAFLIALALTWTIGPMPALLLRFAIYRRPLAVRPAKIYAVAISVVFWILGMMVHVATEQSGNYTGIVWFLMYYASRAILRWGGSLQDSTATVDDARPATPAVADSQPPSIPMTAIPVFESPGPAPQAPGPQTPGPPPPRSMGQTPPRPSPLAKVPRLPPPLPPKPSSES